MDGQRVDGPSDPPARGALSTLRAIGRVLLHARRSAWALFAVLWAWMIWLLSSQTLERAPAGPLWRFLANGVHVPLFGLLALWLALALPRRRSDLPRGWPELSPRVALLCVLLAAGWGAVDEWHQSTTGRTPSILDWLTDAVAAGWVVLVATLAGREPASPRAVGRALWGGLVLVLAAVALATAF